MPKNLKLKAARTEKDMTQSALAEAAGVSRQTINAIEKGEYNPTMVPSIRRGKLLITW